MNGRIELPTAADGPNRPNDLEALEENGWDLPLFTCALGGQCRVAARCERRQE